MAYRGGGGLGVKPRPPKFWRPSKIVTNSTRLWKLLKIAEFRTPTPQDVRKKGSKILKLPSVGKYFTLGMTNKLVVIINSLKIPKIKKILLYEMKFLIPNYSCLQNPWLGGYRPQIPLLSVLNRICWPPPEKNPGYATVSGKQLLFPCSIHTLVRIFSDTEVYISLIYSSARRCRHFKQNEPNVSEHLHYKR